MRKALPWVVALALAALAPAWATYSPVTTGSYVASTLSGNVTLTQTSGSYHLAYNPNGAVRTVSLPSSPLAGTTFVVENTASAPANAAATAYPLKVLNSGGTFQGCSFPGERFTYRWNGSAWTGDGVVSPQTIPGVVAWFDAALQTYTDTSFSTPTSSNDAAIAGWRDVSGSGSGWDLIQSTSGQRPTLKTSIVNSLPVLRFASASSSLLNCSASGQGAAGPVTVFVVHSRAWTSAAYNAIFECGTGFELQTTGASANGWATKSLVFSGGTNNTTSNVGRVYGPYGGISDSTFHVIAASMSARPRIEFDGSRIDTQGYGANIANVTGATFRLGLDGTPNKLDGDIAEFGLCAGVDLTPYWTRRVAYYLGVKYAITVN